jgi:hypothetical protein
MAQFGFHLVQLVKFWTSNTLTFAKWQHIKQGYCCLLQGQQLSYIVLDFHIKKEEHTQVYSSKNC